MKKLLVNQKVREIELRYTSPLKSDMPQMVSPPEIHQLLLNHWNSETIDLYEEFKVLLVNAKGRILGLLNHTQGGKSGTVVDLHLIFAAACKTNSASILICHNHPSGRTYPSERDLDFTKELVEAGKLLRIPVLDHLIISRNSYTSFAEEGLL